MKGRTENFAVSFRTPTVQEEGISRCLFNISRMKFNGGNSPGFFNHRRHSPSKSNAFLVSSTYKQHQVRAEECAGAVMHYGNTPTPEATGQDSKMQTMMPYVRL
jgi:hypothetical protein